MNTLLISLMVVAFSPATSFGLKCMTCDATSDVLAHCAVNQIPVEKDCNAHGRDTACGIAYNKDGDQTTAALGCTWLAYNSAEQCWTKGEYYNSSISVKLSKICDCRTDLCNNPKGQKCLACKGKKSTYSFNISAPGGIGPSPLDLWETGDECKDGEVPLEKWCQVKPPVKDTVCYNEIRLEPAIKKAIYKKYTAYSGCTNGGVYSYYGVDTPVPVCKESENVKVCNCKSDGCNTSYEDLKKKSQSHKDETTIGRATMNLSSKSSFCILSLSILFYQLSL